jgi:hypothetical protein
MLKTVVGRKYKPSTLIPMVGSFIGLLLLIGVMRSASGNQDKERTIAVNSPRPIAKAIEKLEAISGCAITYEDPQYAYNADLADVTQEVRRDLNKYAPGTAPKVLVPKSESLEISYDEGTASRSEDRIPTLLQELLRNHSAKGNAGQFRIEVGDHIVHVIPTAIRSAKGVVESQNSILETVISLPSMDRSGVKALQLICAALSDANGIRVILGAAPWTNLTRYQDRTGATSGRARDILVHLLRNSGGRLSWQLLYDPGRKMYALNIHEIPERAHND